MAEAGADGDGHGLRANVRVHPLLLRSPASSGRISVSRNHDVRARRARIHDPGDPLIGIVWQAERFRGGAWHGDDRVDLGARLVR